MSRINKEIFESMSELKIGEDRLSASFCFQKNFVGFQGHFENKPILPGVCKIQSIVMMYSKKYAKTFRLKEVVSAKYTAPVTYGEEMVIEAVEHEDDSKKLHIRASIHKGEEKVALLKLILE